MGLMDSYLFLSIWRLNFITVPLSHFAELKLEMFENGYNKYHKEDFANKARGRCQSHIWWQTLYITSSLCCRKSPFTTTRTKVCLQSHRQGIDSSSPAKSNTHFHCQTQIFTLSHTQTLLHSLPSYNRYRRLQSINQKTRNQEEKMLCVSEKLIRTHAYPQCLLILGHNGAFFFYP